EARPELCPRCAAREQEGQSGFCRDCACEHAIDVAIDREIAEGRARNDAWLRRSESAHAMDAARAERYRMRQRLRPRRAADARTDPWFLGIVRCGCSLSSAGISRTGPAPD